MINLSLLSDFLHFARIGQLNRAAQELSVSPSTLSVRLHDLERLLGTQLVQRNGRRLVLTAAGETLVEQGQRLLQEAELVEQSTKHGSTEPAGPICFGCDETFAISAAKALHDFCARFSLVNVTLRGGSGHDHIRMLRDGQVDVALLARDQLDRTLDYVDLFETRLAAFGASITNCATDPIDFADLHDERLLLQPADNFHRHLIDRALVNSHAKAVIVLESSSRHTLLEWSRRGLGIALLPSHDFLSSDVPSVPILHAGQPVTIAAVLAWRRDGATPAVHKLCETMVERVSNDPTP